jgi:hypothetical protein
LLQLLLQRAPRPRSRLLQLVPRLLQLVPRLLQLAEQPADILVRVLRQCTYALQLALELNGSAPLGRVPSFSTRYSAIPTPKPVHWALGA